LRPTTSQLAELVIITLKEYWFSCKEYQKLPFDIKKTL